MNKFSIYILLVLIYLGISKSFGPRTSIININHKSMFPSLFSDGPLSVVLIESFETGLLIKTYFQKYKVIYGFKPPREITVRTTKEFWERNLNNKGMSIFRAYESKKETFQSVPMPPGIIFMGDPAFGRWAYKKSGERFWKFHRAYKRFPKELGWSDFKPTYKFFKKAVLLGMQDKAFYGDNNEFGIDGFVTKKAYPTVEKESATENFKEHMLKFFTFQLRAPKEQTEEKTSNE